ncbi:hypothetical protein KQX54_020578 [Cotesia glomerata]|uniref:Uncharacterized protein n=1 Tax=Cotesia glomerata TaxID=32391 RepID=A0AAV7J9P5_COTGL|nr:hypothetical protein KQX54_020578 [Cotesia glomerata]
MLKNAETWPKSFGSGGCANAPHKYGWLIDTKPIPDTPQPDTRFKTSNSDFNNTDTILLQVSTTIGQGLNK